MRPPSKLCLRSQRVVRASLHRQRAPAALRRAHVHSPPGRHPRARLLLHSEEGGKVSPGSSTMRRHNAQQHQGAATRVVSGFRTSSSHSANSSSSTYTLRSSAEGMRGRARGRRRGRNIQRAEVVVAVVAVDLQSVRLRAARAERLTAHRRGRRQRSARGNRFP